MSIFIHANCKQEDYKGYCTERILLIDKKIGQQKDLANTVNATNKKLGIKVHWKHCSFREQGISRQATIHIGAVAKELAYAEVLHYNKKNLEREF